MATLIIIKTLGAYACSCERLFSAVSVSCEQIFSAVVVRTHAPSCTDAALISFMRKSSLWSGARCCPLIVNTAGWRGFAQIVHGESFAVCCSRRRTHGKSSHSESYLYSRSNSGHTAKFCHEAILTHGKKKKMTDGLTAGFAVCHHVGTWQSLNVSCVPGLGTWQTPFPGLAQIKTKKI